MKLWNGVCVFGKCPFQLSDHKVRLGISASEHSQHTHNIGPIIRQPHVFNLENNYGYRERHDLDFSSKGIEEYLQKLEEAGGGGSL